MRRIAISKDNDKIFLETVFFFFPLKLKKKKKRKRKRKKRLKGKNKWVAGHPQRTTKNLAVALWGWHCYGWSATHLIFFFFLQTLILTKAGHTTPRGPQRGPLGVARPTPICFCFCFFEKLSFRKIRNQIGFLVILVQFQLSNMCCYQTKELEYLFHSNIFYSY